MTPPIAAIASHRERQKRDHWMDVYDAILDLDGRIAHLRDVIRDQLPPRDPDAQSVDAIRNAALEEAAKIVEGVATKRLLVRKQAAAAIRALKSE